jgi:long-subunit acyl-CoA synthetase (AMP-forming)
MATTVFRRDHLLRKLVNPASASVDSIGRVTTSTTDYIGRLLVGKVFAGTTAYTLNEYIEVGGTTVYKVTVAGTTAAGAPTAPGYGLTVVSGTATLRQETTA